MTSTTSPKVDVVVGEPASDGLTHFRSAHYIDWAAILAGVAVALAVSFVLLTFGSAVGLSAVSPWTSTRSTVTAVGFGAAIWLLLTNAWAFALGGYLAGRMRHRQRGAEPVETAFRDGAHGAAVWATAVSIAAIVGALVAALSADAAGTARGTAADPTRIATDTLLRPTNPAAPPIPDATRTEVAGLLGRITARSDLAVADRTYLTGLVVARTGADPANAERRVAEAATQLRSAADRARKVAIVMGFLASAALLLGVAAAWWGASIGGRHREEGTVWEGLGGRISLADVARRGGR